MNSYSIAVFGDGQLGKELSLNISCNVFSRKNGLNICDYAILDKIINMHDIIINCIAKTNTDDCEIHKEESLFVNFLFVKMITELCKKYHKKLIHISSEAVYGSTNYHDDLTENFKCTPICQYGIDKLKADEYILGNLTDFLILRVPWLYGKYGKNNSIIKLINEFLKNSFVKVVDDQIGCPTSTLLLINVIKHYLNNEIPNGLYNVRNECENNCNRYEVAKYLKLKLGFNAELFPCKTSEYILPARRNLNSMVNISKLKKYIYINLWKNDMDIFIDEYLHNNI